MPDTSPNGDRYGAFHGAGRLLRDLMAHSPGGCVVALALLLAAAVTEAFGLVMVVPLLYVTGLAAPSESAHPVVDQVVRLADRVGIEPTLPVVLALFLLLAAVRTATGWQRQRALAQVRLGFVDRLREDIYEAAAAARWSHLARWRPSDLHHTLTRDVSRTGRGVDLLFQLVVGTVLAVAQFAVAVTIAPVVSSGALMAGIALALLTVPLVRRARRRGTQQTAGNRKIHAVVAEFLGGLKLVKSLNAQALHVHEYKTAARAMRQNQLATAANAFAARAVLDLGAACTLAALVFFAVTAAELPLAQLLVLVFVFARLMPALARLQQSAQQLAQTLPAYVHATDVAERLRESAESSNPTGPAFTLRTALTTRGVTFAYAGDGGRPALRDVDLLVPAGGFVAVMGPSGAGKSTLAHILAGLLEPCEGEIHIDGVQLAEADFPRWRTSVALVPQEPHLFHETLRTNMARAAPQASEADLWWALELAAAADFVAHLPARLDTVVGDRGTRLSGGERQRIALAQALLRKPALLILDEATAHLDAHTERRVLDALLDSPARMTLVAMTHRTAPARRADTIVLLDTGRVAAAGTWHEVAPILQQEGRDATPAGNDGTFPRGAGAPVREGR